MPGMSPVGDLELRTAWKRAAQGVRQRVAGDTSRETGLADGDLVIELFEFRGAGA
jgi:hypothetical protein